jgi:protein-tyrosine kinase
MERIKLAIERAREQAAAQHAAGIRVPGAGPWPAQKEPSDLGAPVDLLPLDPAHLERHRIVTLEQSNPLRLAFDLLRTQVLQRMEEHGWRSIAVTSPTVQSGKTVVAINLALSIAHHPARSALVVDFDLRRPQVANYLGLSGRRSLNEVLAGEGDLHEAIVHAGIPKFLVLPTRRKVAGPAEMLASQRVADIIARLRDEHAERIVVLDLPPVTAVDDVIAVLPRVDCVLLVVGSGSSTRREIEEAKRHLARYNLLGVVVNKATEEAHRPGYY